MMYFKPARCLFFLFAIITWILFLGMNVVGPLFLALYYLVQHNMTFLAISVSGFCIAFVIDSFAIYFWLQKRKHILAQQKPPEVVSIV